MKQKIDKQQDLEPFKDEFLQLLLIDPVPVVESLFDIVLWQKQQEILESVWKNSRTVVKSCNSGGKSNVAAVICLTYLLTFRPSRVITTAPTFTQVEEILWKEIHSLHSRAKIPIGGILNKTSLDLGVIDGKPWDAMGISTNEVNRFQGFKSPHLLVLIDEALGVAPEIWEAMEGLQPHRILAIGNPLEASGNFYNAFQSPLWNKIRIDGEECVAWQAKHGKIPGLISQEWIKERAEDWGRKSPLYIARVRGEFPEESADTLISRGWVERARKGLDAEGKPLEDENEEDSSKVIASDVATKHGNCETVVGYRYGHTIKDLDGYQQIKTTTTSDKIIFKYNQKQAQTVVVDSDGVGEGVSDTLIDKHLPISEFHGGYGQKAIDQNKFRNLRSQFYWIVSKKFEKGLYNLKHLSEKSYELLKNQLCAIKQKPPDSMGRIQVETKEDMQQRGLTSPDYADTFMMLEYGWYIGKYAEVKPYVYR